MASFKITVAYDGSEFVGWQRQASGTSIQGLLEAALAELDQQPVAVAGAGRTDAGVHALGQVASCSLRRDIDPATLVRALNARLPPTVRVTAAIDAPPEFHARFDALRKTYRYRIWAHEVMSPFEHAYAWHVPMPLDVAAMDRAARFLEGRHDFAAFQTLGTGTVSTAREVTSSRVTAGDTDPLITYEITGDGFLRHMVRAIAGTLVEVGRGRFAPEWVGEVIASRERGRAGPTAPSAGLFLVRVEY